MNKRDNLACRERVGPTKMIEDFQKKTFVQAAAANIMVVFEPLLLLAEVVWDGFSSGVPAK